MYTLEWLDSKNLSDNEIIHYSQFLYSKSIQQLATIAERMREEFEEEHNDLHSEIRYLREELEKGTSGREEELQEELDRVNRTIRHYCEERDCAVARFNTVGILSNDKTLDN
jgi:hypothetical protein